ncbi:glycosyltransferase family 4 protein [Lederbergia galactosidilytica]|uniref:glycosyltransferase family 4 protein n=1 Tax=Lederbergia galactosidilytica TaxID=217031 RepID=UPI0007DB2387|nr:glycosyltransferase family 4 protein [Lederbergia galactosidilytica]
MNILIFTQYYPFTKDLSPEKTTKAVHYFAREWKKDGHRVIVIHNHIQESNFLLGLNRIIKKEDNSKQILNEPFKSVTDGVESYLLPISRYIPKSNYITKSKVIKQLELIKKILVEKNFNPDVLFCHFPISQLQLIWEFQREYKCDRVVLTFHASDIMYLKRKRKKNVIKKIVDSNFNLAFRSKALKESFEKMANKKLHDSFIVYSGAPLSSWKNDRNTVPIREKCELKLLYVGNLTKQKNIHITIEALYKLKDIYNCEFTFHIIGKGPFEKELFLLSEKLKLERNIYFHGYKTREEVLQFMRDSDVFIMVSSPETFGLVYIEAMGAGCIVVGSKGEGIDGVIVNKENGFLATPHSVSEICEILRDISNMPELEYLDIVSNSMKTAVKYSEHNVAHAYLSEYI